MNKFGSYNLRSELESVLIEEGVPVVAIEMIAKETARSRHDWRVAQAKKAALDAAKTSLEGVDTSHFGPANSRYTARHEERATQAVAWMILAADLVGIGGPGGDSGDSTTRIRELRQLGKGRKQAMDGNAWTAAINQAATDLMHDALDGMEGDWCILICPDPELCVVLSTWDDEGDLRPVAYVRIGDCIAAPWRRSIIREGVRAAAELPRKHPWLPVDADRLHAWGDRLAEVEEWSREMDLILPVSKEVLVQPAWNAREMIYRYLGTADVECSTTAEGVTTWRPSGGDQDSANLVTCKGWVHPDLREW